MESKDQVRESNSNNNNKSNNKSNNNKNNSLENFKLKLENLNNVYIKKSLDRYNLTSETFLNESKNDLTLKNLLEINSKSNNNKINLTMIV